MNPTYCYVTDYLGSVRKTYRITGENEAVPLQHISYMPSGAVIKDSHPSLQKRRFTGKELITMHGWNMYDSGARFQYRAMPRFSSIDPMCEKYYSISPYAYCVNNPVRFIDPDGRALTDYITERGQIINIPDNNDNVIKSNASEIKIMQELFSKSRDLYNETLKKMEYGTNNLNLTHDEFEKLSDAVYAESSGSYKESLGILNVLKNRAENQGNSIMDQVSSKTPYGVYGVKDKRYLIEKGITAENKRANVHRAIADGLSSIEDITNGAFFGDGTDITSNSHYTQWGVIFSDEAHNLWNQKNSYGCNQLITTAAYGKTIFTKFQKTGLKWYISK